MENDFIVYAFHTPGEISPFYVGMGRPKRPWSHFCSSKLKIKTHFYHKLSNLLEKGIAPEVKIIAQGLTQEQAWELEKTLIKIWGRIDQKMGCLTNCTDGGEGNSGGFGRSGQENSLEHRTNQSKSKSEQGRVNIKLAQIRERGTPIECYNLKTGLLIKAYPYQGAVKFDGYGQGNVGAVLSGRRKQAYGYGWRYSKASETATLMAKSNS